MVTALPYGLALASCCRLHAYNANPVQQVQGPLRGPARRAEGRGGRWASTPLATLGCGPCECNCRLLLFTCAAGLGGVCRPSPDGKNRLYHHYSNIYWNVETVNAHWAPERLGSRSTVDPEPPEESPSVVMITDITQRVSNPGRRGDDNGYYTKSV